MAQGMINPNSLKARFDSGDLGTERTSNADYDQITWAPGAALTEGTLWTGQKAKHLQSFNLPVPTDQGKLYTRIQAVHNVVPALVGSEPVGSLIQYFEQRSQLVIEIGSKRYPPIMLSMLVPHTLQSQGGTFVYVPKRSHWYQLEDPIFIDNSKDVVFKFVPALGLTAKAAASTDPLIAGTALYGVYFNFAGPIDRSVR